MNTPLTWIRTGLVALALVGAVPSAHAQHPTDSLTTGAALLAQCDGPPKTGATLTWIVGMTDLAFCSGYIRGLADMALALNLMCQPSEEGGIDQLRFVVLTYLRAHPGKLGMGRSALVLQALVEAWPCPNKEKPQ